LRTFSAALSSADPGLRRPPGKPRRRPAGLGPVRPGDLLGRLRTARNVLLLDSALSDRRLGRRAYLAFDPLLQVRMTGRSGEIESLDGRCLRFEGDPFRVLDLLWRHLREIAPPGRPLLSPGGFGTGLAGVLGYDLRTHLERLPANAPRDLTIPDLAVGLYDRVLVREPGADDWTSLGTVRPPLTAADLPDDAPEPDPPVLGRLRASVDRQQYLARVRRIRKLIHDGEVYQVNLSRRFTGPFRGSDVELYRGLRAANPGAYAGFLDTGSGIVLSTSPERFLRMEGGEVRTWPIKGTRPRGRNRDEDRRLLRELRRSEKDRAELSMIVDLLRNDLHRVARPGSVRVTRHAFTRSYASVHHLMSEVTARLPRGTSPVDLLRATFPGGSITGAPKIRACEIIDGLEPVRRGAYTGALGWIDARGNGDLGILIRTVQLESGRFHVHAGGGIVADSDPEAELLETDDKLRAILGAVGKLP
jgi:para-aminobenzoate synthetase component 1